VAVALQRPILAPAHELAAEPLAAQTVRHPKIPDEEPAAVGFSHEACDDALPIPHKYAEGLPGLMAWPPTFVKVFEPARQDAHVRI
jgi:hypothetical protein